MEEVETESTKFAAELMEGFAQRTGLSSKSPTQRYLWTDAFAVCNFLELHRKTGKKNFKNLALRLVEEVHHTLGRHRHDDSRKGWISGLTEEEGEEHPTAGGLRIGKRLPERPPGQPIDQRLEWERDGQYYHYLTKWMHALNRVARVTAEEHYLRWALELAQASHQAFVVPSRKHMHWKMSIDLTRPLVSSMGHHDPLDGFITLQELQAAAVEFSNSELPDLSQEIEELQMICRDRDWTTEDPLGLGGLLHDLYRALQLRKNGRFENVALLSRMLEALIKGLSAYSRSDRLKMPAGARLAFRELGLSIGLQGQPEMETIARNSDDVDPEWEEIMQDIDQLEAFRPLARRIKEFWMTEEHRETSPWREHQDINEVMLATCLLPRGFLSI